MFIQAIQDFPKQLQFKPKIESRNKLIKADVFVVVGMGGSNLASDLLRVWRPSLPVIIHKNYGLPLLSKSIKGKKLYIISSYSGNSEEVLDAYQKAKYSKFPVACVSTGGRLLQYAKSDSVPHIKIPETGIHACSAIAFSMISILKLIGEERAIKDICSLSKRLNITEARKKGRSLAHKLKGSIPIIYSSDRYRPLAYNWKVRLNETGKIPAFYNVFPELNHNEVLGFNPRDDMHKREASLVKRFAFIFLQCNHDHPRIKFRMKTLYRLYCKKKYPSYIITLTGKNVWERIFYSLLLADWTSYYTALTYGLDPDEEEFIEEFKQLIKRRTVK